MHFDKGRSLYFELVRAVERMPNALGHVCGFQWCNSIPLMPCVLNTMCTSLFLFSHTISLSLSLSLSLPLSLGDNHDDRSRDKYKRLRTHLSKYLDQNQYSKVNLGRLFPVFST